MVFLSLSAGKQWRWGFGNGPKQLSKINGVSLVAQQAGLAIGHGILVVVGRQEEIKAEAERLGLVWYQPLEHETILHTLRSTACLWQERTVVLLGDVYYSREVFEGMVADRRPIGFWWRGSEIYGLVFGQEAWGRILVAIEVCLEESLKWDRNKGKIGCWDVRLWTLLRALSGLPLFEHRLIRNELTEPEIAGDDPTLDFDFEPAGGSGLQL